MADAAVKIQLLPIHQGTDRYRNGVRNRLTDYCQRFFYPPLYTLLKLPTCCCIAMYCIGEKLSAFFFQFHQIFSLSLSLVPYFEFPGKVAATYYYREATTTPSPI